MDFFEIMSLIGSVVLVALVLALTYYGSRWYAKRMGGGGTGKYIKVVDKAVLSQNNAVYIVKAGQQYYLLGAADKTICLLSEMPDFEEQASSEIAVVPPFSTIFRGVMNKAGSPKNKSEPGFRQDSPGAGDKNNGGEL